MKEDKYRLAPEVSTLARDLIEDHHEHLAGARISYFFRLGTWEKKHRQVWGQMKLASEDIRFIADFDFILTVSLDAWNHADKLQKTALVDHELYHGVDNAGPDQDDPAWGIDDHDVQEFIAVVSRYGLWQVELEKLMEAAKNPQNTSQNKLFDSVTGEIITASEAIEALEGGGEVSLNIDGTEGKISLSPRRSRKEVRNAILEALDESLDET